MSAPSLIIFLHGIGASGQQLKPLASSWNARLPTAVFATPDAPYCNGYGGNQWFKVDGVQLDPGRLRDAREAFDHKIHHVITKNGFEDRLRDVAFVGVSQGAIMALDGVASGRWAVGAVVAFSGLLPPASILPKSNQTPVLLVHSADDRTIPSVASTVSAAQLRAAGFLAKLEIEPSVGHTISVSGADTAVSFLRKVMAR